MSEENKITNDTNSISSIVQDNSGGLSSIRILTLAWGLIPLIVWSAGSIVGLLHGVYVFPVMPESIVMLICGITGAKVIQRGFEK